MFRARSLIVFWLFAIGLLNGCAPSTPVPPPPATPTPAAHVCHITLLDRNGNVTARYDVAPNDIVRNDPLRQEIWFRVSGQEKHFHGSFEKECE